MKQLAALDRLMQRRYQEMCSVLGLFSRLRSFLKDNDTDSRESVWKMIGEFFRELGVLVIVFYPIEGELRNKPHGKLEILFAGILCLFVGIVIERRR